jgi:[acyl-carrier-protein] S-malonyltransferase
LTNRIAWIFPGQGAQYPSMGQDFYSTYKPAREVLDRCDQAFGGGLLKLLFEGPKEALTLTENAQPAILAVSTAQAEVLRAYGVTPGLCAGLSLGEYTALVVSGSISLEDGIRLTRRRGRYMQEACPPGFGAMTAILGLSCADVKMCCYEAQPFGDVVPANYNSPGQVVISGKKEAVQKASEIAESKGGTCIPLAVSAPFHCGYMQKAAEKLANDLENVDIKKPLVPVFTNVTGTEITDPDDIRRTLIKQVTHPVLWQTSLENMVLAGAGLFIEVGPGRTLTGFVKRTVPKVSRIAFHSTKQLPQVLDLVKEAC